MARIDHAAIRTKSYEEAQRFFKDVKRLLNNHFFDHSYTTKEEQTYKKYISVPLILKIIF